MSILVGVVVLACCYAFRNSPSMTSGMVVLSIVVGVLSIILGIMP